MTLTELKEQIENGARIRIRRKGWDTYISMGEDHYFCWSNGMQAALSLEDITATDWEVVKKKVMKTVTGWVNVYKSQYPTLEFYPTKEHAQQNRDYWDYITTVQVTGTYEVEE